MVDASPSPLLRSELDQARSDADQGRQHSDDVDPRGLGSSPIRPAQGRGRGDVDDGVGDHNLLHWTKEVAHTKAVVGSGCQNLYALKILKAHGLPTASLYNVCQATPISRMTYAAPAWYGFTKAANRCSLQAVLIKATRWGLNKYPASQLGELVKTADKKQIFKNSVPHQPCTPQFSSPY